MNIMRNQVAQVASPLSMVMAGLGSYIYLNWGFHLILGWTPPVQIQDKGSVVSGGEELLSCLL